MNPGTILYPKISTKFHTAVPVSYPVESAPIPGVNIPYVVRQRFRVYGPYFAPLALDTQYCSDDNFTNASDWDRYLDFVLVEETERTHVGGGFVEWDRVFAMIPSPHNQPSQITYQFIGFKYPVIVDGVQTWPTGARARFTQTVKARIGFDYLRYDPSEDKYYDKQGNSVPDPIIPAYAYYANQSNAVAKKLFTELLLDPTALIAGTTPTLSEYQALIADPTAEIVAQDSSLNRWMGNIIERQTIYIHPI